MPAVQAHDGRDGLAVTARLLGALCAVAASIVAIGWFLDLPALTQLGPGLARMRLVTALDLLVLAGAQLAPNRSLQRALAGFALATALLTTAEHLIGWSLLVDRLRINDSAANPGRMSLMAALCIAFVALARLAETYGRTLVAEQLLVPVLTAAVFAVLGYIYGVRELYSLGTSSAMAPATAILVLVLSLALLAGVEGGGLRWVLQGRDAGALLLRRVLPIGLIAFPALGYAGLHAQQVGWMRPEQAAALRVSVIGLLLIIGLWFAARAIRRADAARERAIDRLQDLRANLEAQVEIGVAQTQQDHARLAIYADRSRIAADLHDLVIQRLFAAGLDLEAARSMSGLDQAIPRIVSTIDNIDAAIAELRSSIFQLRTDNRAVNVRADLESAMDLGAGGLGFSPTLTVVGDPQGAAFVMGDLLAVLREALSNVARHARATEVSVTLEVEDSVRLRVRDNGSGIPAVPLNQSGLRNMRLRAEWRGGTCEWGAIAPQGTVVDWQVPLVSPLPAR